MQLVIRLMFAVSIFFVGSAIGAMMNRRFGSRRSKKKNKIKVLDEGIFKLLACGIVGTTISALFLLIKI